VIRINEKQRAVMVLVACMVLSFVLGSIHAFSVLLESWEQLLSVPRGQASLIYSLALVSLTVAVLIGHRLYSLVSSASLFLLVCIVASLGVWLSIDATKIYQVWIFYSLMFGFANGLGYGFGLQFAAQAMPHRKGLAMGAVTASYALGAMLFVLLLREAVLDSGLTSALTRLAVGILVAGLFATILVFLSGMNYQSEASSPEPDTRSTGARMQILMWAGYGTCTMAGLMIIGHAAGIVANTETSQFLITLGPFLVVFANMAGGLLAGWSADQMSVNRLLKGLPLLSAVALLLLAVVQGTYVLLAGLALVGLAYGALIALFPVAVYERFGAAASARIYGRIFTAWGIAGLSAPWLAGMLYDRFGNYTAAMLVAGLISLLSAGLLFCLKEKAELSNK
jgi:OFA family oxalate/formate antiporter-like MFS transporter